MLSINKHIRKYQFVGVGIFFYLLILKPYHLYPQFLQCIVLPTLTSGAVEEVNGLKPLTYNFYSIIVFIYCFVNKESTFLTSRTLSKK